MKPRVTLTATARGKLLKLPVAPRRPLPTTIPSSGAYRREDFVSRELVITLLLMLTVAVSFALGYVIGGGR